LSIHAVLSQGRGRENIRVVFGLLFGMFVTLCPIRNVDKS
jgi:hypothetical protein